VSRGFVWLYCLDGAVGRNSSLGGRSAVRPRASLCFAFAVLLAVAGLKVLL
jgi:hypothetical protein